MVSDSETTAPTTVEKSRVDHEVEGREDSSGHGGRGTWKHAAFHVATTIATPAAYAPLPFALASLGWPLGFWGYWSITFFQQVASLGNNIAIQIAAGSSLKAVYKYYHVDGTLTLQHFIIFFGIFELFLSQLPDIHSLRWVNALCTFSTIGFASTTIGVTIYNGKNIDRELITTEGRKVGIKKALVFYVGKAPKGVKTNWIMHEYRLIDSSRKSGSSKLDEWVLCRIYKKNSSSQKPVSSFASKEVSNGSSSSSSSHLDDVLESLPEIDDRFFSLPRMNSLKTSNHGEKFNFQNLGSGNFDWATLAGLSSVPELAAGGQGQAQTQGIVNNCAEMYVPSISPSGNFRNTVDEEVQSGLRTQQRVDNSGFFQHNSNALPQPSFPSSFGSFGFRYPTQPNGVLGFDGEKVKTELRSSYL